MGEIETPSRYKQSMIHRVILAKDHRALQHLITSLPVMANPSEVGTEETSIAEEAKADEISSVIDCRDVPNRDTPLHLTVKLSDHTSAQMLMSAGADWSLQNAQGWSALQEAICCGEERIVRIIVEKSQTLAWSKWCRRLPRVVGTMRRMRNFYMEIGFRFESSVIPFVSRIAPSDTYRIWKRGANLRADMTLSSFDGFRIERSNQSMIFLGDGSEDGKIPAGSLLVISHKKKEVVNAFAGAGDPATETEIDEEVLSMLNTNIFRPGLDVTKAELLPQLTWRRQEKTEMVGSWNTSVYDMHNVIVSVKSRRVPGIKTNHADEEDHLSSSSAENESEDDKKYSEESIDDSNRFRSIPIESSNRFSNGDDNKPVLGKRWFGHRKQRKITPPPLPCRRPLFVESRSKNLFEDSSSSSSSSRRWRSPSVDVSGYGGEEAHLKKGKNNSKESEYKKSLSPVLWLSPDFPLRTEELLPLLDIIANKVKAIRRLRDLLTTKLPAGTFPVKVRSNFVNQWLSFRIYPR